MDEVYEIASTAKDDGSIREEYKEPKNSKLDETIDKVIYGLKDDYIIGIGANPLNIDFSLFVKIGKPKEINKLEKITETKKFFGLLKETNREIIIYPPFN